MGGDLSQPPGSIQALFYLHICPVDLPFLTFSMKFPPVGTGTPIGVAAWLCPYDFIPETGEQIAKWSVTQSPQTEVSEQGVTTLNGTRVTNSWKMLCCGRSGIGCLYRKMGLRQGQKGS
jgi:hypothetical protein